MLTTFGCGLNIKRFFMSESKNNRKIDFVIDGTNVCGWHETNIYEAGNRGNKTADFTLLPLLKLVEVLLARGQSFHCWFDASTLNILNDNEQVIYNELLKKYNDNFYQVIGGIKADPFVLASADKFNAAIISNDSFGIYLDKYPWLERNKQPLRLFKGGKPKLGGDNHLMVPHLDINEVLDQTVEEIYHGLKYNIQSRKRGVVKTFNEKNGWGFVTGQDGEDIYFNKKNILVKEEMDVEFEIGRNHKGELFANNVTFSRDDIEEMQERLDKLEQELILYKVARKFKESDKVLEGEVEWYDRDKEYGVITYQGDKSYFFYGSEFNHAEHGPIPGQKVIFQIGKNKKGACAIKIFLYVEDKQVQQVFDRLKSGDSSDGGRVGKSKGSKQNSRKERTNGAQANVSTNGSVSKPGAARDKDSAKQDNKRRDKRDKRDSRENQRESSRDNGRDNGRERDQDRKSDKRDHKSEKGRQKEQPQKKGSAKKDNKQESVQNSARKEETAQTNESSVKKEGKQAKGNRESKAAKPTKQAARAKKGEKIYLGKITSLKSGQGRIKPSNAKKTLAFKLSDALEEVAPSLEIGAMVRFHLEITAKDMIPKIIEMVSKESAPNTSAAKEGSETKEKQSKVEATDNATKSSDRGKKKMQEKDDKPSTEQKKTTRSTSKSKSQGELDLSTAKGRKAWWDELEGQWKVAFNFITDGEEVKTTPSDKKLSEILELTRISLNPRGRELKAKVSNLSGLAKLSKLKSLDVADQKLKNLRGVEKLEKLERIKLNSNELTSLAGVEKLPKLKELHCAWNKIKSIKELQELPKLDHLVCGGNLLESVDELKALSRLKRLECFNISLDSLKILKGFERLEQLNCSYNPISSLKDMPELPALKKLNMDYCQLSSTSGVQKQKSLVKLEVEYNELKDIKGLDKLENLTHFNCSSNKLTYKQLQGLKKVPSLTNLSAKENKLKDDQQEKLQEMLKDAVS